MKSVIHINRSIIQRNAKNGTNYPVCRVERKDCQGNVTVLYGMEVDIKGPSRMVYRPDKPRRCGAKLWIETEADIEILGQTSYSEVKQRISEETPKRKFNGSEESTSGKTS